MTELYRYKLCAAMGSRPLVSAFCALALPGTAARRGCISNVMTAAPHVGAWSSSVAICTRCTAGVEGPWKRVFSGFAGHRHFAVNHLQSGMPSSHAGFLLRPSQLRSASTSLSKGGRASGRVLRPPTRLKPPPRDSAAARGKGSTNVAPARDAPPHAAHADVRQATRDLFLQLEQRLRFRGYNMLRWALGAAAALSGLVYTYATSLRENLSGEVAMVAQQTMADDNFVRQVDDLSKALVSAATFCAFTRQELSARYVMFSVNSLVLLGRKVVCACSLP